jgi:uncharacterized protein (DUF4415 family)
MRHSPGDKILIKAGIHVGNRGILISQVGPDCLRVKVIQSGEQITLTPGDIVNYSLAARKAWVKMPSRKVGRPHGTRVCDRVSVTLRIDRELWDDFHAAESQGLIEDRTATVNILLRQFLQRLKRLKAS